jgi:hypothetical protein
LTSTEAGTHVRFDRRVNADRPFIRFLNPAAPAAFGRNHAWAITRATTGLEP